LGAFVGVSVSQWGCRSQSIWMSLSSQDKSENRWQTHVPWAWCRKA